MIKMIEVEVLINDFKDRENYNKKISIVRNGKEIEIQFQLLQKGDIYKITKERYAILSKKGIVSKLKKDTKEDKGE